MTNEDEEDYQDMLGGDTNEFFDDNYEDVELDNGIEEYNEEEDLSELITDVEYDLQIDKFADSPKKVQLVNYWLNLIGLPLVGDSSKVMPKTLSQPNIPPVKEKKIIPQTKRKGQPVLWFFDKNGDDPDLKPKPSDAEIRYKLGECPLDKYIALGQNKNAIQKLKRYAFDAYTKYDHNCHDSSFALLGPPSSGKSHLVDLFVETIADGTQYPYVKIQPKTVKNSDDIFNLIAKTCKQSGVGLVDQGNETYNCPPCIVFIDEVHALGKTLMESGLLNAMEAEDATLTTESGKHLKCHRICWIVATTDAGKLFDAFHSRFDKIQLYPQNKEEIALILKDSCELPIEVCEQVAKYCRIPREAKRFAKQLLAEKRYSNNPWNICLKTVAEGNGLDELGLHWKEVEILKALGNQGTISKANLATIAKSKIEELEQFVIPPMIENYEDRPALIFPTPRGFSISSYGLKELDKRKIPHLPESEVVYDG